MVIALVLVGVFAFALLSSPSQQGGKKPPPDNNGGGNVQPPGATGGGLGFDSVDNKLVNAFVRDAVAAAGGKPQAAAFDYVKIASGAVLASYDNNGAGGVPVTQSTVAPLAIGLGAAAAALVAAPYAFAIAVAVFAAIDISAGIEDEERLKEAWAWSDLVNGLVASKHWREAMAKAREAYQHGFAGLGRSLSNAAQFFDWTDPTSMTGLDENGRAITTFTATDGKAYDLKAALDAAYSQVDAWYAGIRARGAYPTQAQLDVACAQADTFALGIGLQYPWTLVTRGDNPKKNAAGFVAGWGLPLGRADAVWFALPDGNLDTQAVTSYFARGWQARSEGNPPYRTTEFVAAHTPPSPEKRAADIAEAQAEAAAARGEAKTSTSTTGGKLGGGY